MDYDLIHASKRGNLKRVRELINEGANIHADEALRMASIWNHVDIIRLLIDNGADWTIIRDNPIVINMLKKETNNMIKKLTVSYLSLKQTAPKGIHKQLLLKTVYKSFYLEICSAINRDIKVPSLKLIALANLMKLNVDLNTITSEDLCNRINNKLHSML